MVSSAEVAMHAGVSRSTVSQILNGHDDRFVAETVARVRASAQTLGYRPSVAGRTLVRGTSDIVITLVPDMAFSPFFRSLVGLLTRGLADHGYTNLLRLASADDSLEDAILALRPFAIISVAPLGAGLRSQIKGHGVHLFEPTKADVDASDGAIGRLQAEHLTVAGYSRIVAAVPDLASEQAHSLPRENGIRAWCGQHDVELLPTIVVPMRPGGAEAVVLTLPPDVGVAAYNDEVALAVLGAALQRGLHVPQDVGVVGVDDSSIAHLATPSITTVAFDATVPGKTLLDALLAHADLTRPRVDDPDVPAGFSIVPGGSTARSHVATA